MTTTTQPRYETDREGNFIVTPEQMDAALAAERRTTVERIRERLAAEWGPSEPEAWQTVDFVNGLLDEEAAR